MQPIPPPQGPPPPGYPPPGYPYPYPPPPPKSSLLWLWILLGVGGAVVIVGILAAIAIPSFMRYQQHAKRSSADLNLRAIERSAKRAYAENAAYPTTSAEPTPALGSCCAGPGHKCAPESRQWSVEPWTSLDFEIVDAQYFSYSYQGAADGQSFTARAHVDLDCDGTYAVYELVGTVRDGVPSTELIAPTRAD